MRSSSEKKSLSRARKASFPPVYLKTKSGVHVCMYLAIFLFSSVKCYTGWLHLISRPGPVIETTSPPIFLWFKHTLHLVGCAQVPDDNYLVNYPDMTYQTDLALTPVYTDSTKVLRRRGWALGNNFIKHDFSMNFKIDFRIVSMNWKWWENPLLH